MKKTTKTNGVIGKIAKMVGEQSVAGASYWIFCQPKAPEPMLKKENKTK